MSSNALKLVSSMATRDVLADMIALYRRATGVAVETEAAGGVDVAKRVRSGEAVDVVVLAGNAIDQLIADARLLPASRVDLVRSGIAVAIPAGRRAPAIDSEAAVKRAVLGARTIGYSTGPSGVYLEQMFDRWGVLAQIRPRIVVPPPGVPVGSLVASGAVELGFQQLSELKNLEGVQVLGPLPPAIQSVTLFAGAVASVCARPDAVRTLLAFMASPDMSELKVRHGMEAA